MTIKPQITLFINQSLASAYNYLNTGRLNKALELMSVVKRIDPDNVLLQSLFKVVASAGGLCEKPDVSWEFGKVWYGEPLNGKSIEVFCDQGIGDTINMLRYFKEMKSEWDCRIFVNCYAHYETLTELMKTIDYVDGFIKYHIPCDFHTNIFSIPSILCGIKRDIYYPAHFTEIMQDVPPQPKIVVTSAQPGLLGKFRVGICWQSNPKNELATTKSIPADLLQILHSENYELYSLVPNLSSSIIKSTDLKDLKDTAILIETLNLVISVDTAVLHLAGAMNKKTFALLAYDADPRWGYSDTTVWYPSVRLFRQQARGMWRPRLFEVKCALESLAGTY